MSNQGSGVYVFPNGDRYAGDYSHRNDGSIMRQGIGQYTSKDGLICKGTWSDDKLNGKGEVTFASGAVYEGMFVNNCMHGNGKYKFSDGSTYEGLFQDNRLLGKGIFTDSKGQKWCGEHNKSIANGFQFQLNM